MSEETKKPDALPTIELDELDALRDEKPQSSVVKALSKLLRTPFGAQFLMNELMTTPESRAKAAETSVKEFNAKGKDHTGIGEAIEALWPDINVLVASDVAAAGAFMFDPDIRLGATETMQVMAVAMSQGGRDIAKLATYLPEVAAKALEVQAYRLRKEIKPLGEKFEQDIREMEKAVAVTTSKIG